MTLEQYTDACIKFSGDTKEWGGLDPYRFYTTAPNGWEETCDNANGGIDVSWAFQETEKRIRDQAAVRFLRELQAAIELARDDGWDAASWATLAEKFT